MKSTLSILFICILFSTSCGKKAACTAPQVAEVSARLSAALSAYFGDQSVANCLAYKAALNDYLEVVDDCSFVTEQEVADARQELDDLDCN
ncbi:MAG: hypothetical protein KDC49_17085 [Saprospiraceae bacterium]|nr:hypothetical protein [Saprospiraceae bacterium]